MAHRQFRFTGCLPIPRTMHAVRAFLATTGLLLAMLGQTGAAPSAAPAGSPPPPAAPPASAAGRIKITKLADLPPRTYEVKGKPSELIRDDAAMLTLAAKVETDIRADLARFDIEDASTLRRLYGTLLDSAILKKDFKTARDLIDRIRNLQEKPAEKLTSGLVTGALVDALDKPGDAFAKTFRENLDKALAPLPFADVQNNLKSTKAGAEILSANLIAGSVASTIDPVAADGKISQDFASEMIRSAYLLAYFVPNKDVIAQAFAARLDANKSEKKADIWADHDVTLDSSAELTPVVVGIWDSGSDVRIFKDRLFVNSREIPGNGKDDDGDGYVDDVNGIAWTLHSDISTDLLLPIGDVATVDSKYKADMKGIVDLEANVDSPEAAALRKKMAGLPQADVKPFLEGLNQYGMYAHGTHVAGIAVRGNPAARIIVVRNTFDHHLIPEKPTIEQARKDASAMVRSVEFMRRRATRVVNMSWGGDLKSIDNALEQNGFAGTPEERRDLAKKIYDVSYKALYNAVKDSRQVLFVIAAGNSDNDVKFEDVFPSSFQLPNVIVVGAVDQAGEQTSFTSFGNVDVYANGFEVESFIPGGETMKLSGTSMAAPAVTNLAAKIFAIAPGLTPAQAREMILNGSRSNKVGSKDVRLIDPKATLALAQASSRAETAASDAREKRPINP